MTMPPGQAPGDAQGQQPGWQPPCQQPPQPPQPPQFSVTGAWSFGAKLIRKDFIWLPIVLLLAGTIPSIVLPTTPTTILTSRATSRLTESDIADLLSLGIANLIISFWSLTSYVVAMALVLKALVGMTRGEMPVARLDGSVARLALRLVGAYLLIAVVAIVPMAIVMFLMFTVTLLGVLFFLAFWVIGVVAIPRFFLTPVLIAEGTGIVDAYRESWRISKGSWWRIVGWQWLTSLVFGLVVSFVVLIPTFLFRPAGIVVSAITSGALLPIWIAVLVTLTHACRWRIAERSGGFGWPTSAPAPAPASWPAYEPPVFDAPTPPAPPAPPATPALGEDSGPRE